MLVSSQTYSSAEALAYHLQARGRTYEIIVAADGNDGTRELVAEMARTDPRISVIGSAERGGEGGRVDLPRLEHQQGPVGLVGGHAAIVDRRVDGPPGGSTNRLMTRSTFAPGTPD